MTDGEIKRYFERVSGFMIGSLILWIVIIIYQLFVGIISIFWGYGVATLLLMVYNLIGCIRYIKTIHVIRECETKAQAAAAVNYFERQIPFCWIFLFINLIFGGVLGFAGNLYDLILAYRVKKKKDEILGAPVAPGWDEAYREIDDGEN